MVYGFESGFREDRGVLAESWIGVAKSAYHHLSQGETDVRSAFVFDAGRAQDALSAWNAKISTVQRCKEALSKAQMGLLRATCDLHRPLIRSLYQRMHPHPLFTDIDFEFDTSYRGEELYFKVFTPAGNVQAYPSTVFSASQIMFSPYQSSWH